LNMVLSKIFEPEMEEERGDYRKLHNKKLHELYSSPDIIWVIKSSWMRRGRGTWHV
jgi:hypothetical protein